MEWAETYGGIYKYYGLFNKISVSIVDEKILQKILVSNGYDFVKPESRIFKGILGNGLVMAEGKTHKRQHKLMNPSFNHDCIKVMEK